MHGVNIRSIVRAGVKIPVRSGAKLDAGDRIELVGLPQDCDVPPHSWVSAIR